MKFVSTRLRVERLEDRTVPAIFGVPWPDPGHLTLSFVPDGTPYSGGGTSNLFATMDALMPRATWQGQILKAIQSWTAVAGINVSVVADSGDPLGTPGAVEGDQRFGDIRVSATTMSNDAIASGAPFSWTGTTFAGDLMFNSTCLFTTGTIGLSATLGGAASTSGYDLYTVAVQEAGHIFGIDNSADPGSVMYTTYTAPHSGLSAGDVAGIQALYGTRTDFDNAGGNSPLKVYLDAHTDDTFATANMIAGRSRANDGFGVALQGVISDTADVDFYKIQLPRNTTGVNQNVTVMVYAADRTGLDPLVHLYDDRLNPVPYRVLSNESGVMSVQTSAVSGGRYCYVSVEARDHSDAARNMGTYGLAADVSNKTIVDYNSLYSATLNNSAPTDQASLTLQRGALMVFSLGSRTGDLTDATLNMSVYDSAGNLVFSIDSKANRAASTRTLYLAAGTYTVKYNSSGAGLTKGLTYNLQAMTLTDNIGPYSTTGGTGTYDNSGYIYAGSTSTSTFNDQYWF
jgi:hypothetical protein